LLHAVEVGQIFAESLIGDPGARGPEYAHQDNQPEKCPENAAHDADEAVALALFRAPGFRGGDTFDRVRGGTRCQRFTRSHWSGHGRDMAVFGVKKQAQPHHNLPVKAPTLHDVSRMSVRGRHSARGEEPAIDRVFHRLRDQFAMVGAAQRGFVARI
jgi:hypothetical protein